MFAVSYTGMELIEKEKAEREAKLKELMKPPFDLRNEEQRKNIEKYINDFERDKNWLYLYQFVSLALRGGLVLMYIPFLGSSFCAAYFFLQGLIYLGNFLGMAEHVLDNFNIKDLHDRLNEMKKIYNWCLKSGNEHYSGEENSARLLDPMIQRMISVMAPLCPVDFMRVWRSEEGIKLSWLEALLPKWLQQNPNKQEEIELLRKLIVAVETRALDLGVMKAVVEACRYFRENMGLNVFQTEKLQALQTVFSPRT